MKTFKTTLLTIAVLLCSISASAHDFEVDGIYYFIMPGEDLEVKVMHRGKNGSEYDNEYSGTVTIPSAVEYNGKNYSVTSIGHQAFVNCSGLTSITIPHSVSFILPEAFKGCENLKLVINYSNLNITKGASDHGHVAYYADRVISAGEAVGDYFFRTDASGNHYLSGYIGNDTDLKLPEDYKGGYYKIGERAFDGYSNITSITIPNFVKGIENYAFYNCTGLTSITISGSVTRIGEYAFSGCSNLTSVTIPDYSVGSIGDYAFYGCSGLMNVFIGNSVKIIGDYAFAECSSLTKVIIGNSVTNIGKYTFSDCWNIDLVINFSDLNITKGSSNHGYVARYADRVISAEDAVGDYLFDTDADGLHNLLCYIGNDSILTLPENYKGENYSIGEQAFCDCSYITSIAIPNSVTSIGEEAFGNCTGLASITIGNSVTSIGEYAFRGCTGLTSIIIPNSVTSIGKDAFEKCDLNLLVIGTGVASIESSSSQPVKTIWLTNTPPSGASNLSGKINYVSNDLYRFYQQNVYPFLSSMFEVDGVTYVPVNMSERTCDAIDVVHNSSVENMAINSTVSYKGVAMTVKEVMPYTFYENKYVKTLSVDNAGHIGKYAFYGCDSLQTVTVSNQGEIGEYAFSGCLSLTSVILSESITNIDDYAFRGCSALTKMIIPNSVITLGSYCFSGCKSMQSIELGNGLSTIKNYAFIGCSALSSISIPSSVTVVGDYVFDDCTAMTKVVIEDRTKALSLGSNGSNPLFADCPLNSVYIGGKISYSTKSNDGYSPFYRNTTLETVVISDREDTVYDNEFYGCTGLKNVTIGNGVKSIGKWAFSGCSSLDKFSFGGNVESIGQEAFSDCTGMTQLISYAVTPPTCEAQALEDINKWECTLKIPESCKAAYLEADQWKDFFFVEDVLAAQKYTLTYTVDGEVYHTESIALNATVPTIETPTKEGHTFNGWSELPSKMPAHDVTVEGSFTVNIYTVTYKVDGETYATEEVAYGESVVLKEAPAKEGYIFSGWSEAPETMPARDVTIEGTFAVDGIEEIVTERLVDVYTLQGVMVKRQVAVDELKNELPAGIYIVGGKKFVVK